MDTGLVCLHLHVSGSVTSTYFENLGMHLRMGYLMLTPQREARSLAAVPGPLIVQKAERQGLKVGAIRTGVSSCGEDESGH
ncbi:unnamed protein product [Sphagnum troendelagicum]|uniref:Uncharacterized protein n=1 Tax=Sphagnum jensenii TaxID=128206 RepID=A0ABP0VLW7_9BRYO